MRRRIVSANAINKGANAIGGVEEGGWGRRRVYSSNITEQRVRSARP